MRRAAALFAALSAFACVTARAEQLPAFVAGDRVLVVAPHPDDEALGAAGLLMRAKKSGADVRVVYLTHGDDNEVSGIFYLKKPLITKSDFVKIGDVREDEAETAMGLLGVPKDHLVFLGYPDGGLLTMWRSHWNGAKPYRHLLTKVSKVPYPEDYTFGHPYTGDALSEDLRRVLFEYRPTRVFVTAPFDRHPDHRAAYLFTELALLELKGKMPDPLTFGYVIHARRWPRPRAYRPSEPLSPPEAGLPDERLDWRTFPLSADETASKKDVILKYRSQITYNKNRLLSFARSNELFLPLGEQVPPSAAADSGTAPGRSAPRVDYSVAEGELRIDLRFEGAVDEMGGMGVELYAFRADRDFSRMPKFALRFFGRKFYATDETGRVKGGAIRFRSSPGRYQIRMPLATLGDPDHLFASASTAKREPSPELGSWKLLKIER